MPRPTLVLLLFLPAAACQKVVQLNLHTTAPQTVIQGDINDSTPPYTVTIGQSVNFYANNTFPPVSGAQVWLGDSTADVSDSLVETTPGNYTTVHFPQAVPGHTYTMRVVINGTIYTAVSTMPQKVPLDSVGYQAFTLFGQTAINPVPYFQDPPTGMHYYQFVETLNGTRVKEVFVFDDRLSSGRYISEPLENDTSDHVNPGDTLLLDMYCIDANVYNYLNEIVLITDPNTQSTSPANPTSNISGGCLGYFSAHTLEGNTSVVP